MNITSNIPTVQRFVNSFPKQVRYGASLGLNKLAESIRDSELKAAHSVFTLRGSWYKPRSAFGFNVEYAKKDKLNVSIYTRADWLKLHESGGIKVAGGMIAIPTEFVKRNKRDLITKGNKPKNIKGAFKMKFENGQQAIVKKYNDGNGSNIVVLYWLEKQAKIKKEFEFYSIGRKVFDRRAKQFLIDGIAQAVRTGR